MADLKPRTGEPLTQERASELLSLTLSKSPLGLHAASKKLREDDSDAGIEEVMAASLEMTRGRISRTLEDGSTEKIRVKADDFNRKVKRLLQYRHVTEVKNPEDELLVGPSNDLIAGLFISDLERIKDQGRPDVYANGKAISVAELIQNVRERTPLGLEHIRMYRQMVMAQDARDKDPKKLGRMEKIWRRVLRLIRLRQNIL